MVRCRHRKIESSIAHLAQNWEAYTKHLQSYSSKCLVSFCAVCNVIVGFRCLYSVCVYDEHHVGKTCGAIVHLGKRY